MTLEAHTPNSDATQNEFPFASGQTPLEADDVTPLNVGIDSDVPDHARTQ